MLTILGVTIAGIVQAQQGRMRELVLLAGPIIVIILGILGYANVKVFYRRFIEAWITILNIELMLENEYTKIEKATMNKPVFPSKHGGYIARFERRIIEDILQDAQDRQLSVEDVVQKVVEKGDTLTYTKLTFTVFTILSILLIIAIAMIVTNIF